MASHSCSPPSPSAELRVVGLDQSSVECHPIRDRRPCHRRSQPNSRRAVLILARGCQPSVCGSTPPPCRPLSCVSGRPRRRACRRRSRARREVRHVPPAYDGSAGRQLHLAEPPPQASHKVDQAGPSERGTTFAPTAGSTALNSKFSLPKRSAGHAPTVSRTNPGAITAKRTCLITASSGSAARRLPPRPTGRQLLAPRHQPVLLHQRHHLRARRHLRAAPEPRSAASRRLLQRRRREGVDEPPCVERVGRREARSDCAGCASFSGSTTSRADPSSTSISRPSSI